MRCGSFHAVIKLHRKEAFCLWVLTETAFWRCMRSSQLYLSSCEASHMTNSCLFTHPGMIQSGIWQSLWQQANVATSHTTSLQWPQWRLSRTSCRKHAMSTQPQHHLISYDACCVPEGREVVSAKCKAYRVFVLAGGSFRTFLEMMPWGSSSLLGIRRAPSWFERVRQLKVNRSF